MHSKIFKKYIGSEFLSKYFPAQSSVCNTTHFHLNEPSQQNQNFFFFFFLGSIPKNWDFCLTSQENAVLGRLRPYRLWDCRIFGNMIHLPALCVLSNLLSSSMLLLLPNNIEHSCLISHPHSLHLHQAFS